mmetsp:Transcript_124629/g.360543  ORF Transcript_124629/g.360543 Transcript_124629/m.360543 type:complete len:365 (+) Transcript_124629:134-1228(+)
MGSAGSALGICVQRDGAVEPVPQHNHSPHDLEAEHHEHMEFVKALRIERAKEEDPEFWSLKDVSGEADEPKAMAIKKAIEELKLYYDDWNHAGHDVFWHRKSHQVVLAVVVCRAEDGSLKSYRGMNTEVSLPAGSLCAERAAIARAASDMRRAAEIEAVAVLDPKDKINPLWPCEVCQSWLAKLKDQNAAICVMAVSDSSCGDFVVRINGVLQSRPCEARSAPPAAIADRIRLAEDVKEQPWEAKTLVYVDGAWDQLDNDQFAFLKAARAKGTHLMAGIYSDDVVKAHFGSVREPFESRLARLLEDRHVSSVLTDAPWEVQEEFITRLGIRHVVIESKTAERRKKWCQGSYDAARKLGLVVQLG